MANNKNQHYRKNVVRNENLHIYKLGWKSFQPNTAVGPHSKFLHVGATLCNQAFVYLPDND